MDPTRIEAVSGDLLEQPVDAIVNAWNRNVVPWWLLLPQGVSRAIKRAAGIAPFQELAAHGPMPLGSAVVTSAGRLPHVGIVHVAGINLLWRASEQSIRKSVRSAVAAAIRFHFESLAFPAIGAGSGGFSEEASLALIREELERSEFEGWVRVVRFKPPGN